MIDFIDDHKLSINAAEVGAYLRDKLMELKEKHPIIGDVRGMGLMQAIELVEDRETKKPATAQTAALLEAARENRILIGKGGFYGNVLAHLAAAEHQQNGCGRIRATAGREFRESCRRPWHSRAQVDQWTNALFTKNLKPPSR